MNITIVSKYRSASGVRVLTKAANELGHTVRVAIIGEDNVAQAIEVTDMTLLRIGPSSQQFYVDLAASLQGEPQRMVRSLLCAFDKADSYQVLRAADIAVPQSTAHARGEVPTRYPAVAKILHGNRGEGVELVKNEAEYRDFERKYPAESSFLVQEYIEEAAASDKRLIIAGGQLVGAMRRRSTGGDFRANLHTGGSAESYVPTAVEVGMARRAVEVLGLVYGGVDIIDSNKGPLVLEVNPSPGFAISTILGVDVAKEIIKATAEGATL